MLDFELGRESLTHRSPSDFVRNLKIENSRLARAPLLNSTFNIQHSTFAAPPRIHLVTYGTTRFRHRQWLLGASARLHRVVDTVTHWNPARLQRSSFDRIFPSIGLHERGSGFWSWKPFIIGQKLIETPDGDLVFYCDVGRRFPYKILDRPLIPFLNWMDLNQQEFMPGLQVTWRGPLSTWTKRDAFVFTNMDQPNAWAAPTVQASFSLWRNGPESRAFVSKWLEWCSDRRLISDDPSLCGEPELPDFHEHRHDQALLSLLCLRNHLQGFDAGSASPPLDTRDPSAVMGHYFETPRLRPPLLWKIIRPCVSIAENTEEFLRHIFRINPALASHPLAMD